MNSQKLVRLAAVAWLLLASSAAAQGTVQATDDERPPADESATKKDKAIPPQEAGDTSEVLAGEESGTVAASTAASAGAKTPPISVAVTAGWGTDFEEVSDFNLFGFGFGVRGGYTLDFGLYLGGQVIYYLGGSGTGLYDAEASGNEMLIGADVGYNIHVDPVIIRPSLAIGLSVFFTNIDGGLNEDISDTSVDGYAALGAAVIYPIGNFFVGGDARFVEVLASESVEAVTLMAMGGLNFGK